MRALPDGLDQAFAVAAGELGMCCAAWLYVENAAADGGIERVLALRDALGRVFPVLDAVADQWLRGVRGPQLDPSRLASACAGASHVVFVGVEALFLDALLARLQGPRCALLCHSSFEVDWPRVLSNFDGRVEAVDLDHFQAWAGPRSVLLTFAYGASESSTHVLPEWLRITGDDVRAQFRSLLAWDVLRAPMFVYPRWLVEIGTSSFTEVL